MSLKMTLMQPEMARIQRKYGVRKDPQSQQQMQLEMMKLYKKYKMNPLGCILPMFIQFPIFMAMYEVVKRINASSTVTEGGVTIVQYGTFALHNTKVFNFFELNTSFLKQWPSKIRFCGCFGRRIRRVNTVVSKVSR